MAWAADHARHQDFEDDLEFAMITGRPRYGWVVERALVISPLIEVTDGFDVGDATSTDLKPRASK